MKFNISEIEKRVKDHFPDKYYCNQFIPGSLRDVANIIDDFNIEMHYIAVNTGEIELAIIKYKWWLELIHSIYNSNFIEKLNLAGALAWAIKEYKLDRDLLENLIYARINDLNPNYSNFEELGIRNQIIYGNPLKLLVLAANFGDGIFDIIENIAESYGLINDLKNIYHLIDYSQGSIPRDLLSKIENKDSEIMIREITIKYKELINKSLHSINLKLISKEQRKYLMLYNIIKTYLRQIDRELKFKEKEYNFEVNKFWKIFNLVLS